MKTVDIWKSRFLSHTPFRLVHDVTYRCNCKCKTCERWKKSSNYSNELSTDEVFKMLEDAKETGLILYAAEGGEPLMRKDLPQILEYAKKLGLFTTVVTNGFYLKERHNEILPFTDTLIVSIDSNDELHDEMRGLNGIREKAIEGIQLSKNSKSKLIINSVISNQNLDKIDGLVKMSEELDVPIIFQPMDIAKGYNEKLRPTQNQIKKTFSRIAELKKAGYKIGNSYSYLHYIISNKQYTCHAPKCYIFVLPNGDIVSCCDVIDKVWGNVKGKNFNDLFKSKEHKEFCKKMEKCFECRVSAIVEISLLYSLHPRNLLENIFTSRFSFT